jgi:hypothetical protein
VIYADIERARLRGITCALPATIASLPPAKLEHHPALIAAFALAHEVEGAPHERGAA